MALPTLAAPRRQRLSDLPLSLKPLHLTMWIVAIAWMYIATTMALAEGVSPQGTWLGASITFLLYGVAPLSLVLYLMGAPARRKAIRAAEQAEREAAQARATAGTESASPPAPPGAP